MNKEFYLSTGIIALIYASIAGLQYYSLTGERLISAEEAKKMIKNNEIKHIIDIRTKFEYDLGNYPGSIHLPVNEITQETTKKFNKNDNILVYCNTGQRARHASEVLIELGFKNVFYISGTYTTIIEK